MDYMANAPAYVYIRHNSHNCQKCKVRLTPRKRDQLHAMPTHCETCLKARRVKDKARREAKRAAAMAVHVEAPSCLVTTAPVHFPLEVEAPPVGGELPPANASVPRSRIDENAAPTQQAHGEAQFKRQKLNGKGTNQSGAQVAWLQPLAVLHGDQGISKSGNSSQPMPSPVLPESELVPTICLDELSAEDEKLVHNKLVGA
jgi:hypothetical protein